MIARLHPSSEILWVFEMNECHDMGQTTSGGSFCRTDATMLTNHDDFHKLIETSLMQGALISLQAEKRRLLFLNPTSLEKVGLEGFEPPTKGL